MSDQSKNKGKTKNVKRQFPKWRELKPLLVFSLPTLKRKKARLAAAYTIWDLRDIAKRRTPTGPFDYTDGSAESEVSLARARKAYQDIEFNPSILKDVSKADLTCEVLGQKFSMPMGIAPTGFARMMQTEGEIAGARAAEKFGIPLITFIDTQGAFPGLEAEERGQAEAIARNLLVLSELTGPVISVVIGEGGSGGALALGVADRILMMENACYSVITPEGCASILWHSAETATVSPEQASAAAEALNLTAKDLKRLNLIDDIVAEPAGGAHSNHKEAAEILRAALVKTLEPLSKLKVKDLVAQRYDKFRKIGAFNGDN